MPGMDGFETAAIIRTRDRSRRTPIIFVSAHAEVEREVPAEDVLIKPLAPEIVRSKVASHIKKYRSL
jgi:CheY-like chemotaxis protein